MVEGMDGGIATARRLEYARGYLALGLIGLAAAELQALSDLELEQPESLSVLIDLEMERKAWTLVVDLSHDYATRRPREEKGWISWAYALRELQRVEEAREVLLRAEALHGAGSALLHYNLACYHCLLGDKPEARRELDAAIRLDESFAAAAREDTDLAGLFD
jgi:tetratricopeptide (TPR) repeat protein